MAQACLYHCEGGVCRVCGHGFGGRRYLTKEEKLEWLEEYQSDLEKELAGVKERMQELKQ